MTGIYPDEILDAEEEWQPYNPPKHRWWTDPWADFMHKMATLAFLPKVCWMFWGILLGAAIIVWEMLKLSIIVIRIMIFLYAVKAVLHWFIDTD